MRDWPATELGKLCSFQAGDAFSKDKQGATFGDVPFIKVSDMNLPGNEFSILRANNWVTRSEARRLHVHQAGATVFAKIGEALRANRRRLLARPTIIDNNMMSATAMKGVEERWLFYLLRTLDFNAVGRGSALPYLAVSDLKKLVVPHPPLREQEQIAAALSAFDDKIELNRRSNETLEAMAQAIFRDWFVDFGPTHRKLAGTTDPIAIMGNLTPDPARAAELATLFPDALNDEGVPEGWRIARVEEVIDLAYGKSLPKTARREGVVPVYGSGGVGGTHNVALAEGPGIIVGRKGTVGSLFWEPGDFFAIDTVFYVVPHPQVSMYFVWELLRTLGLDGMNTDAAVPGLNRSNVYRLEFAHPGIPPMDAFGEIAGALRSKADANLSENRTLAETRDYLLPRLMSGKVRVGDTGAAA